MEILPKASYDQRKNFIKPYFDLKIALALKPKVVPVLFSDNVSSIFSSNEEERDWAINEWKDILLLADDAKNDLKPDPKLPGKLVFDGNGGFPQRYILSPSKSHPGSLLTSVAITIGCGF